MEKERCACCRLKSKPRSEEQKKALVSRINRLTGQMNGIKKMIEEDRYCDDVLLQLSAIDKAVKSLATIILEEHMRTCLIEDVQKGNTAVVDEVVELFRRFQ